MSTTNFQEFSRLVHDRLALMSKGDMFTVDVDSDTVWDTYITAFPPGSNPIYRKRAEHDCSCCKQFIRAVGNVVSIVDGQTRSIWGVLAPTPYDTVAGCLDDLVTGAPVVGLFGTKYDKPGTESNFEQTDHGPHKWHHFHAGHLGRSVTPQPEARSGVASTNVGVIGRGLSTITVDAVDAVLDLIDHGVLYRGPEFLKRVQDFRAAQTLYRALDADGKNAFVWSRHADGGLLIRNSAIGALLVNLSVGRDIEDAVKAYERITAPENYRRPTALVTKSMVSKAMETVRGLGLEPALERRHAAVTDIPVTSVLWVDRSTPQFKDDTLESILMEGAKAPTFDARKVQGIPVDEFLASVLLGATSVDVQFAARLQGNLVALTAPVHDDAAPLFRWSNGVSWSYAGEVTDSIKARVKAANGDVNALGRVSLAWCNTDDLDLHVTEPNGTVIFYGDKRPHLANGRLDVDMNVRRLVRDAVENVAWSRMAAGDYTVQVHNYTKRESVDVGCVVEIDVAGVTQSFSHEGAIEGGRKHVAFRFHFDGLKVTDVHPGGGFVVGRSAGEAWGLSFDQFYPVSVITTSPNHWGDEAAGNKHWMFLAAECASPDPVRSVYNEYLRHDLQEHRKVFETLGSRTKVPASPSQLSGLGFSESQCAECVFRVDGRPYRVVFGNK